MNIWFTSDPHYYHANVIKYCNRPFNSVEEMNEKMILNWNSVVRPGDKVYVLGDFAMAFRPIEIFSSRLMGDKELTPGNHDFCHPYNKKSRNADNRAKWIQKYQEHGWQVSPITSTLDISGVAIVNLSHMPYDCQDTRYKDYIPKDDGRWLLHGHTHSKERFNADKRLIHVGVDAWDYTPIHLDQIIDIIVKSKK